MYYLRKKAKNFPVDGLRITTTDCLFDDKISALWQQYVKKNHDVSCISLRNAGPDFICGKKILCNTHWKDVDEVLIPMNLGTHKHWILGRLVFKDRCIYLYNSLDSALARKNGLEAAEKYAVLLPLFFASLDLFALRSDIDMTSPAYRDKNPTDAFRVKVVTGLPSQSENDCGAYVLAFAEYLIQKRPIPSDLNIVHHRDRISFLLYEYGMKKMTENIDSGEEVEPKNMNRELKRRGKKKIAE
ncbi:uncharacterized protein LOC126671775 [Mercurialis annua]|uniref:uncharacterized protein LOC126671775 n=1 Tax=Mercurialis annua TaxID=3986 RepID=UPI00215FD2B6|nr:uncharacterized protein LOC126671775 [Mercurialis annua]